MPKDALKYLPCLYIASHGVSSKTKFFENKYGHNIWFITKLNDLLKEMGHNFFAGILFNIQGNSDKFKTQLKTLSNYATDIYSANSLYELNIHKLMPATYDILIKHPYYNLPKSNQGYSSAILDTYDNIINPQPVLYLRLLFNLSNITNHISKNNDNTVNITNKDGDSIEVIKEKIKNEEFIYVTPEYCDISKIKDNKESFMDLEVLLKSISQIHIFIVRTKLPDNTFSYKCIECADKAFIDAGWQPDFVKESNTELIDLQFQDEMNIIVGTCRTFYD